jgi:hypothetical protein
LPIQSAKRAVGIERAFHFDESRGVASENPHVRVWRLLAEERRHQSGYTSDFYLYNVTCRFVFGVAAGYRFSPSGRISSFTTRGLGVVATMDTVVCGTFG